MRESPQHGTAAFEEWPYARKLSTGVAFDTSYWRYVRRFALRDGLETVMQLWATASYDRSLHEREAKAQRFEFVRNVHGLPAAKISDRAANLEKWYLYNSRAQCGGCSLGHRTA